MTFGHVEAVSLANYGGHRWRITGGMQTHRPVIRRRLRVTFADGRCNSMTHMELAECLDLDRGYGRVLHLW